MGITKCDGDDDPDRQSVSISRGVDFSDKITATSAKAAILMSALSVAAK